MSDDRAEDIDASYPDSGSVRDSKEGGLDEIEVVEDGIGEGGWELQCRGAPLPKHFDQVLGNHWGSAFGWGLVWQYQVLVDSVSPLSSQKCHS